jgi:FMN-dependent oxidoreductase (nitrilotriacetate monooxygenase family)
VRTREAILFLCPEWNGMHPAAWRAAADPRDVAMDLDAITALVQAAERARLHALFLPDALGVRLEVSPAALSSSAAAARLEPFTLMGALAARTERIGLILTAHTSYELPFHLARRFASLDHMSDGRAGWNVVSGGFASGAAHFGHSGHIPHERRYRQAEETLEAVLDLWDSWEDDAFRRDREGGRHFDPERMHRVRYEGEFVRTAGPLNLPRPVQGHPVIAQAGSSAAGRAFAAHYGEVVFTLQPNLEAAQSFYDELKDEAAGFGRDPDHVKILPSLTVVLGESEGAAAEKADRLHALADPGLGLELLGAFVGADLSGCAPTDPLPQVALTDSGTQTVQQFFVEKARREGLTIKELVREALGFGSVVTTPDQLADQIETWVQCEAADGFNITFADLSGSFELFVDRVIPELQRRGVFHTDYRGRTLRENLGLPRPPNRHSDRSSDVYALPLKVQDPGTVGVHPSTHGAIEMTF